VEKNILMTLQPCLMALMNAVIVQDHMVFKPAKGQFQIYYRLGAGQSEYIPDFVAETETLILMAETKARNDLATPEVQTKASAAIQWCRHASKSAASVGGKPWKYVLIPHDEINESRQFADFLRFTQM